MRLGAMCAVLGAAIMLSGCEYREVNLPREILSTQDGEIYQLELVFPTSYASDTPRLNVQMRALGRESSLAGLRAIALDHFRRWGAMEAEIIGADFVSYQISSKNYGRFSFGVSRQTDVGFGRSSDGRWGSIVIGDDDGTVDVLEVFEVMVGEEPQEARLLESSRSYIRAYGRTGTVLVLDCATCEGDLELATRVAYRLLSEMRTSATSLGDTRGVEFKMFSARRESDWHFPVPVIIRLDRADTQGDWPEITYSEDTVVELITSEIDRRRSN